jgi:hypothetical protein
MLMNTRRRALGLLLAAAAGLRFGPHLSNARAAENTEEAPDAGAAENADDGAAEGADEGVPEKPDCYETQKFGAWFGQASDSRAGARANDVTFDNADKSPLRADVQVSTSYDSKLVLYSALDALSFDNTFLKNPDNRLIMSGADGKEAVNEPLCGNCTDIEEDKVAVVMPLATAPLLRESDSVRIAIKLVGQDECGFKLDCKSLRKALEWAEKKQEELARQAADQACTPAGESECFITTACCGVLGLDDDCFELRSLRAYRDTVLANKAGGLDAIAVYYELAPKILARLPQATRRHRLLAVYARYILPAAIAARLGLAWLAYRLYSRMLAGLAQEFAPGESSRIAQTMKRARG